MAAERSAWAPGLAGRTVIVTGAGRLRSIGRAVALEFARNRANLVLLGTGRSPSTYPEDEREVGWRDIDSVADEVRALGSAAHAIVCDVSSEPDCERAVREAVERFGAVNVLVNNAGAARSSDRRPILDLSLADWSRVLTVNLTGAFLMSRAVARRMVAQGRGGSIVNISSVAGRIPGPNTGAYGASKAGLNAFSRVLAMELAREKIRVNAVLPGLIDTSRMDDLGREAEWAKAIRALTPLGVAGQGTDVARMCAFLCSDMGEWITGQDIAVDGGGSWH
jgi:3-oxoacyl-[acyl-carrier protein] reductase/meso-butanediol dehydrogenase/(S,S)-butanediol dehydrogenase/diacetyl reductase